MPQRLAGQLVDGGDPVADEPVFVVDTGPADEGNWSIVATDRSAADGSWSVTVPNADAERYHAVAQFEESGTLKNALSKPFLTSQPFAKANAVSVGFDVLSPAVSVGSAIPDSAVYRWPVDEGSGQTLTDELQNEDITTNFENWVSGSQYVGESAKSFDGVDDRGTTSSALPELGINESFSLEVWTEPQGLGGGDEGNLIYQHPTDDNRVSLGFDSDGGGDIAGALFDGSDFVAESSTSITLNDGLKQIVYTYDASTQEGTIYVDGVEGAGTNRPNFTGTSDDAFYLSDTPANATSWDGVVDLVQPHDEVLSQEQIDSLYADHPST